MPAPVLQLRVPEDTLARLDDRRGEETRSAWVLRLIDRELDGPGPAHVTNEQSATAAPLPALPAGDSSPGVACAGPGCWQRNTSRYGLHRVPLCPACRAAVWIKGHFDHRTDVRKAKEASVADVSGRRREAYAQLLTTARKALEQARLRQATLDRTRQNRQPLHPEPR